MHWSRYYIGIPWKTGGRSIEGGLDCWGLLRYFYQREYGIVLTEHAADLGRLADRTSVTVGELEGTNWIETDRPVEGDGVGLGNDGRFSHVGIYVPLTQPCLLQAAIKSNSNIATIRSLQEHGWSLIKYYRHAQRI